MALRLTVELVCDVRRAPACHGTYVVRGDVLAPTIFAVEQEARSAGWGRVRAPGNIIRDDVCPACRAFVQPSPHRGTTGP